MWQPAVDLANVSYSVKHNVYRATTEVDAMSTVVAALTVKVSFLFVHQLTASIGTQVLARDPMRQARQGQRRVAEAVGGLHSASGASPLLSFRFAATLNIYI